MTGAQFKTLRQLMGLKIEWMGKRINVQPRSIQRWEAENDPVPEFAATEILKIHTLFKEAIVHLRPAVPGLINTFRRYKKAEAFEEFEPNGLPEFFHGAAVAFVANELMLAGYKVEIVWL